MDFNIITIELINVISRFIPLFIGLMMLIGIIKLITKNLSRKKANKYVQTSLTKVAKSDFYKVPLMNKEEYKLFCHLSNLLEQHRPFRLFTQVSMGEFINSPDKDAFLCINSKRVDFLIINGRGEAVIVIEYQGKGHFQNNAIERDAIKKEACRKANITYLEFYPDYGTPDFDKISHILNKEHNNIIGKCSC